LERAFPELKHQHSNEEEEESEPLDYTVETSLRAGNGNGAPAANKTGLNIHRFRPGKWTNIFSSGGAKRRNFKLESDDSNVTLSQTNDEDVAQIDLIRTSTQKTATVTTPANATTAKVRFVPGARRRYGYKNFRQIQANETVGSNDTQLRSAGNEMFYRNINGNRNLTSGMAAEDLIEVNGNRTIRRPFAGRLYEKQLFRSYIQKKKLIQLLQNETDTGLEMSPNRDLMKLSELVAENEATNQTTSTSTIQTTTTHAEDTTSSTTPATTTTDTSSSTPIPSTIASASPDETDLNNDKELEDLTTTTATPKPRSKSKLKKLSVKLPKADKSLNFRDSAVAMVASQPEAFDSRYSDLPHLIKRVSDNQNRIAAIYKGQNKL